MKNYWTWVYRVSVPMYVGTITMPFIPFNLLSVLIFGRDKDPYDNHDDGPWARITLTSVFLGLCVYGALYYKLGQ